MQLNLRPGEETGSFAWRVEGVGGHKFLIPKWFPHVPIVKVERMSETLLAAAGRCFFWHSSSQFECGSWKLLARRLFWWRWRPRCLECPGDGQPRR